MSTRRRPADWVLLGVTLALLASWPALMVYEVSSLPRPAQAWVWATLAVAVTSAAGCSAAWAAVAWVCRGPAPRGLALVAALGYAAVVGVYVADLTFPAWQQAARQAGLHGWKYAASDVAGRAAWVPAIPLLVFCRRWGDAPRT